MNHAFGKIKQDFQSLEEWLIIHKKAAFVLLAIILGLIAAMEYFTNLTFFSCFVDDEFQSADAARALATTGETTYDRAYPATFLLAQWIKIFGFSEVSCRSLSGVYGVLAILSLVFITAKWFQSLGYTAIVGMMFLAEPVLTYYFRFVRMYSLAVLLCLWVYYCLFQGLEKHWGYLIPVIPLLLLSGKVHVNCLILLAGVAVYVILKAFQTKRKRYIVASLFVLAVAIGSLINYIVYRKTGVYITNPAGIFNILTNFVSFGGETHFEYVTYLLRTSGAIVLSIALLAIIVVFCIKKKSVKDELLYVASVSGITVLFFWLLSDRYFTEQYIVMVVPFFLMLLGYAYILIVQWKKEIGYGMMAGLVVLASVLVCKTEYTYLSGNNPENMDYREAYGKISNYYDLDNELVPTIASLLRTDYYDQIVPKYEYITFDRTRDMEIWMEYGKHHPTGIVTVEWLKMPQLTQGVQDVILNWTDRVSGEGVDDSGVNVSYYCFAECDEEMSGQYQEDGVFWDDDDLYVVLGGTELLSTGNMDRSSMLFIELAVQTEMEEMDRYVGLYLPDEVHTDSITYTIPLDHLRGLSGNRIQHVGMKDLNLVVVE